LSQKEIASQSGLFATYIRSTSIDKIRMAYARPSEATPSKKSEAAAHNDKKKHIVTFYGRGDTNMKIKCMILDKPLHPDAICLAHLYPDSSQGDGLQSVRLSVRDISNDRMFLLLFRPIEEAYDRGALCFHPDRLHNDRLAIRILDPSLRKIKLMDAYDKSKRPPDVVVRSFVAPVVGELTFGDIEDESLKHNGNLPFRRVLRLHAGISQIEAIEKKWIEKKDVVPFRCMSPDADDFALFGELMSEAPDSGDEGDEGEEGDEHKSEPEVVTSQPSATLPSNSSSPSSNPSAVSSKAKKRRNRKNKIKS